MELYIANSFSEYIDIITKIGSKRKLWYRGQSKAEYRLSPGVLRHAIATHDWAGREIEPRRDSGVGGRGDRVEFPNYWTMLEKYKDDIADIVEVKPKNDLAWLCLAQHYGLPTPLLDWSTDPLVALFFALDGIELITPIKRPVFHENDDYEMVNHCAAIFAIDPIIINKINVDKPQILDLYNDYDLIFHNMVKLSMGLPICIRGEKSDRRMCRQSGNFTAHGCLTWPIDYINEFRKDMIKIIIPYSELSKYTRILTALDITKESIYLGEDEKDKIAKKKAKEHIKRFESKFINIH